MFFANWRDLNRVIESYPDLGATNQSALAIDSKSASGALRAGFEVAITTAAGGAALVPPPDVVLLP